MPYKIDPKNRKCVIKADTGEKVGCTKGSVKKYLAALHANINESDDGLDWARELVNSDIWAKWDDVSQGDYISYKRGINGEEQGLWQVVDFRKCHTYNPENWDVHERPCMRLQSVEKIQKMFYFTGSHINLFNHPDLMFKIHDTKYGFRDRGFKFLSESEDNFDWVKDIVGDEEITLKGRAWFIKLPGSVKDFEDAQRWAFNEGFSWSGEGTELLDLSKQTNYKNICKLGSIFGTDVKRNRLTFGGSDGECSETWDKSITIAKEQSKQDSVIVFEWNSAKKEPVLSDIISFKKTNIVEEKSEEDPFNWVEELTNYSDYIKVGQVFQEAFGGRFSNYFEITKIDEDKTKLDMFTVKDPDLRKSFVTPTENIIKILERGYWVVINKPINESEEDEFGWAKNILNQYDEKIEIDPDDVGDLNMGGFFTITGTQDGLDMENMEVILLEHRYGEEYLFLFPSVIENSVGDTTHCGDSDNPVSECHCEKDGGYYTGIGRCWWIDLSSMEKINYYPNRRNFTNLNESKEVITEGKYDSLTRQVVKDIMQGIKSSSEGDGEEFTQMELPNDIRDNEWQYEKNGVIFSVELTVHHQPVFNDKPVTKPSEAYYIETAIVDDEDDIISVTVIIDPQFGSKVYDKIFYKLQEDIRHEIEHLTQIGVTDTSKLKTTYSHHKNKFEIPALVHGFYRRAKLEKRPLDEIMVEDLDSEIERGNLSKREAEKLLKIWIDYAKQNLPSAIYSDR